MGYILCVLFLLILLLIYAYIKYFAIKNRLISKIFFSLSIITFTFAVIVYPKESFNAALSGLKMWFEIVFPSLLPFFIGSELLINLGVVNSIGVLLEPVMRPLFNVPGCGSFPFIMSITSGYPVGSKIVAELYNKKLCNKAEAQRLLSFCSTSGPLFMIGAVAIGMLNVEGSGFIIAASHYLGALSVGLIFRFYKFKDRGISFSKSNTIKRAAKTLIEAFNKETRPFGMMLSDAVKNSVNSLLAIGGFIVLFSVVIRLLILSGFVSIVSDSIYIIIRSLKINTGIISPIISGFFEITVGCKLIASVETSLYERIIAICGIISWGGLSIHAQVASMISTTDLKMSLFMLSKALHSIFSCLYAYIIINIIKVPILRSSYFVFSDSNFVFANNNGTWTETLIVSSAVFICIIIALLCIALLTRLVSKIISSINY